MRVVGEHDWFRVSDLGEGVTLVEEPYAGDLLSANLWHVRGRDRDLVVDSGLGIVPLQGTLPWLFDHAPVLVLSHAHLDHMGGAHEFDDVRVHAAELAQARAPGATSLRSGPLLAGLGLASYDGLEGVPSQVVLEALPTDGYDVDGYALRPSAGATAVHEGDVVDLGDRRFTVLHLPGHTPGSLSLLDAEAGVLLTGDVVYEGGLIDSCLGSDVGEYRRTMQRLLDVEVERVLPGHGPVLSRAQLVAIASDYLRDHG